MGKHKTRAESSDRSISLAGHFAQGLGETVDHLGDLAFRHGVDQEEGNDVSDRASEHAVLGHCLANFNADLLCDRVGRALVSVLDDLDACDESHPANISHMRILPELTEAILEPLLQFLAPLKRGFRLEDFEVGQGGGAAELVAGETVSVKKGAKAFVGTKEAVEDFLGG